MHKRTRRWGWELGMSLLLVLRVAPTTNSNLTIRVVSTSRCRPLRRAAARRGNPTLNSATFVASSQVANGLRPVRSFVRTCTYVHVATGYEQFKRLGTSRSISVGKRVLHPGNTRMAPRKVEQLAVLRMNHGFMKFMRLPGGREASPTATTSSAP